MVNAFDVDKLDSPLTMGGILAATTFFVGFQLGAGIRWNPRLGFTADAVVSRSWMFNAYNCCEGQ